VHQAATVALIHVMQQQHKLRKKAKKVVVQEAVVLSE
jgi:hypothetical protein